MPFFRKILWIHLGAFLLIAHARAASVDFSSCQNYLRQNIGALSLLSMDRNGNFRSAGNEACAAVKLPSVSSTGASSTQRLCIKSLGQHHFFTILKRGFFIDIDLRSDSKANPGDISSFIKYRFEIFRGRCLVRDLHMAARLGRRAAPETLVFSAPLCAELACAEKYPGQLDMLFRRIFLKSEYTGGSRNNISSIALSPISAAEGTQIFTKYTPEEINAVRTNVYGGRLSPARRVDLVQAFCRVPQNRSGFGVDTSVKAYQNSMCGRSN